MSVTDWNPCACVKTGKTNIKRTVIVTIVFMAISAAVHRVLWMPATVLILALLHAHRSAFQYS